MHALVINFFTCRHYQSFASGAFSIANVQKLLSQKLLIETADGIKLTPLYDEMKLRAGGTDRTDDTDVPVDVPINVPNLAAMLGVSEKTIKRDIAAMQSAGLIKRIGSDKTGHWETIVK